MSVDIEIIRMIARAPLRTVRWSDVAGRVPNAARTLQRLQADGALVRIAHGVYTVPPHGIDGRTWKAPVDEAGLALASARFGERRAVLMGIGAARYWGAIPRALGVTTIAVTVGGRPPVTLTTGGTVHLIERDIERLEATVENTELGEGLVTVPAQTLFDLLTNPGQGGMHEAAAEAAEALMARVSAGELRQIGRRRRGSRSVDQAITRLEAS